MGGGVGVEVEGLIGIWSVLRAGTGASLDGRRALVKAVVWGGPRGGKIRKSGLMDGGQRVATPCGREGVGWTLHLPDARRELGQ